MIGEVWTIFRIGMAIPAPRETRVIGKDPGYTVQVVDVQGKRPKDIDTYVIGMANAVRFDNPDNRQVVYRRKIPTKGVRNRLSSPGRILTLGLRVEKEVKRARRQANTIVRDRLAAAGKPLWYKEMGWRDRMRTRRRGGRGQ